MRGLIVRICVGFAKGLRGFYRDFPGNLLEFFGILYYTLRTIISLRQPEEAVEFGLEAMIAAVIAYALLVAVEVMG